MWTRTRGLRTQAALGLTATAVVIATIIGVGAWIGSRSNDPGLVFAAVVQAVAAAVLVAITAWYARATWAMAKEMKQQTDALIAPVVSVRAERSGDQVLLTLENSGRSPATDVHLSTDRAVLTKEGSQRLTLGHTRLFEKPLLHLAPGSRYETIIGSEEFIATESFNDYSSPFTITVRYAWGDEAIEEQVPVQVHSLFGLHELLSIGSAYYRTHPQ